MYAPVGLIAQLRTDLPRLVAEGRAEVENRVRVAHWVGEMTVQYGKRAIEERLAPRTPAPTSKDGVQSAEPAPVPVPVEPFHGYATLSAAEIVPLLERIPHVELSLVRDYEMATRARRTILARLAGLLGE